MTILQIVLPLLIFHWALRVPGEPVRCRVRTGQDDRVGS